ncbi:MAG: hypothetical protein JXL97_20350, partial [Bacteroidales bacterium]|nr:hypothetical protein [Bacteroidales bacterium]
YNYDEYNRIAGQEGKSIVFIDYSEDYPDSSVVFLTLEIPPNALDSNYIFNMFEFSDSILTNELDNEFEIRNSSEFFYFVAIPENFCFSCMFYEDLEQNGFETNHHFSLIAAKELIVTYKLSNYTVKATDKLYRIKIPKTDEWATGNIWLDWNTQGFPTGYNKAGLAYLINGKWTIDFQSGTGNYSLNNWEEIVDFQINEQNNTIIFNILDMDYAYVLIH